MKAIQSIFAVALFLIIYFLLYLVGVNFVEIDVVFYASLKIAVLAVIVSWVLLYKMKFFRALEGFEKKQLVAIFALLGYIIAISVPTVIDRSLSFYILEKLQQRGGGIEFGKFNYIFTSEYMREHRLVDVRLTEQVASGTIIIQPNGCVRLTRKGEIIATFGQFFRKNLLPKHRLLMGEYTDQLTDPFKRSDEHPDYLCQ